MMSPCCPHDEPLLRRLAGAKAIEVVHPAKMEAAEARAAWEGYLAARGRRHLVWLLVDLPLSAVTGVALFMIPGPNVVGLWFAYRAACHALAFRGTVHARGRGVATEFRPSPTLDATLGGADDEEVARVAADLGLKDLGDALARAAPPSRRAGEPTAAP
jgi:hypothetical protein